MPTQMRSECGRLSPGFLYYDETGDSPSGWSCLTGCRILDAALKQRSGECPLQGGPAIHRLPGLFSKDHLDLWSRNSADQKLKQSLPTGADVTSRAQSDPRWHSGPAHLITQAETGDSPSGWSCLTGCRILDAALKQRSGECPLQGGPAIHRLPGLFSKDHLDLWSRNSADQKLKQSLPTGADVTSRAQSDPRWHSGPAHLITQAEVNRCTVDAECPNRRDKCCQSQCKNAVFREDILPPVPTVRILESKAPVSFLLSWEHGLPLLDSETNITSPVHNNLTEPVVYVLQVKTYFGPEFDSRLASNWKTLIMVSIFGWYFENRRAHLQLY
ncbi:hypothetical protein P879_04058 [Paragonimus westermani]|uniref:WAP domain-containing protein n=1 Tax=Paragonimus westermani TaxID=34504 RepID=A0A8T0DYC7_9TREM|nr:hypothetical protein P879_04058 [Paragonimus westermani]